MSNIFSPQEKVLCHLDTIKKYFEKKNQNLINKKLKHINFI